MKKVIIVLFFIFISKIVQASIIEELDLPPEGAHGGQMLLGFVFTIGYPLGDAIDAENSFVENSTYTFSDSGTTKKFYIDHIGISFGLMFEYMVIDYVGIYSRFRRNMIIQRTSFGSDYENTSEELFSDYSIMVGPSFHLTTRKWWDVSITPIIGYSFGSFTATPVATTLLSGYTGGETMTANGLIIALELRFTAYFSGGFFLSAGFEWAMNMATLDGSYTLTNPQTGAAYGLSSSFSLHTTGFIMAAGYAFSN